MSEGEGLKTSAMATIKAAFLAEPVVVTCPLHPRGHMMAGSYPHLRKQTANSREGILSGLCVSSPLPQEPSVNKLSAAWAWARWYRGHRLSGTRKLERSGTGQCHASQSSEALIMMCLDVNFLGFSPFGLCSVSGICSFMFLLTFGNFPAII